VNVAQAPPSHGNYGSYIEHSALTCPKKLSAERAAAVQLAGDQRHDGINQLASISWQY
jgi:hypothetical protein